MEEVKAVNWELKARTYLRELQHLNKAVFKKGAALKKNRGQLAAADFLVKSLLRDPERKRPLWRAAMNSYIRERGNRQFHGREEKARATG